MGKIEKLIEEYNYRISTSVKEREVLTNNYINKKIGEKEFSICKKNLENEWNYLYEYRNKLYSKKDTKDFIMVIIYIIALCIIGYLYTNLKI